MNPEQKLIIQKNYSLLISEILAEEIADKLFSNCVIEDDDLQRVYAGETYKDKAMRLIKILLETEGSFEPFLHEIKMLHPYLVQYLTQTDEPGKDIKTLADVKELQGEQILKTFLVLKVLEVSGPTSYNSKNKGLSQRLTALIADTEGHAEVTVYDAAKFSLFKEEEAIILSDFVKKSNGCLVVTKLTNVFTTYKDKVIVPPKVMEAAKKKVECTSIHNATLFSLDSTVSSVKGKVMNVPKLTKKRLRKTREEVPFKRLKIKDCSGSINVALWRDSADTPVEQGDFVALHNFTKTQTYDAKRKAPKPVLSNSTAKAEVEFISSFAEISDEEDSEDESVVMPRGDIIGIENLYIYRCCINPECNRKVDTDFRCSRCTEQYNRDSAGCAGILKVIIDHENKMTIFKMFTESVKQLLESMNLNTDLDLNNKEEIEKILKDSIPIRVKFAFRNDIITAISKL